MFKNVACYKMFIIYVSGHVTTTLRGETNNTIKFIGYRIYQIIKRQRCNNSHNPPKLTPPLGSASQSKREVPTQKITMMFRIIFLLSMLSTTFAAAAPSIESASDGSVIISVAEGATVMVQELDANGKVIGCASNLFLFVPPFPFPSP